MKKSFVMLLVVLMVATLFFAGCSQPAEEVEAEPTATEAPAEEPATEEEAETPADDVEAPTYADGVYFAKEDISDSWSYFVTVTVEGGAIVDTYWGGTNLVPQGDKRVHSENQEYGMVAYGSAASYWYEQAEAAEAWLLENQNPAAFADFYTDDAGHTEELTTDGGAAVSIHVIEFFSLAEEALAGEPVVAGSFDVAAPVVSSEYVSGDWTYKADFTVVNGTIVNVNLNALFSGEYIAEGDDATAKYFKVEEGKDPVALSKKAIGDDYGMVAFGGAQAEWYQQAESFEAYILENQAVELELDESGHTDAVAGVSIHVNEFVELFNAAFAS